MIKIAFIPARYAATRFPYKLMQALGSKTVIRHTYDNTVATKLFDDVIVVTDHKIIFDEIVNNGGKAMMSKETHQSGSDRIAEVVQNINVDVIINVQGDEPFVQKDLLKSLLDVFEDDSLSEINVASAMKKLTDANKIQNPNYVKLVIDANNNAMYFSRSPIPFNRSGTATYYEHIGVYAYRKSALLHFTKLPEGYLEKIEMLEQLRYLENGIKIKMVETNSDTVKIDVPEDLAIAEAYLANI